ncbi:MAG TPA: gamma-glutamylcyclotransferase family protein [Planctomycetaceae bacterium]
MNPFEFLPLFTFGTLRRGERNHHYLEGTYERWLPGTLRDYSRIVAPHGWPAIAPAIGSEVAGDLFFMRQQDFVETLGRCDILEELPPGELIGPHYQRAQVVVETAAGNFAAWAYVDPRGS